MTEYRIVEDVTIDGERKFYLERKYFFFIWVRLNKGDRDFESFPMYYKIDKKYYQQKSYFTSQMNAYSYIGEIKNKKVVNKIITNIK